jgi:tetratricopeptide (TPR) repeat protein
MGQYKKFLLEIALFVVSISLFSQTAEEWKKIGNIELDSANYDKAIEYYQKAIETDSNYFDAYYNMGLAYLTLSDYEKAMAYYNKALTLNDTIANIYFALGFIYANKQDNEKAIAYYNQGLTINDTIANIYFTLGSIYAETQDYDKAIKTFKKGINLKPNSPEEHYHLGLFYQEQANLIYTILYIKKAARLGDTSAIQFCISNEISWENNFVKPDYELINLNIENKESNFYYSKLWDRFQQGDSTMNLEEKRHLYYGYTFNKNYSPYLSVHDAKKVNAILNKEKPTKKEWKKLVSLLNISLSAEPFSIRYLYYQILAYNALNKSTEVDKNFKKIRCIVDALYSTGDGLLKETAIHVIAVSNEYDYLFLNNLSTQGQALIDGGYDVLYLQPNENGLEEMWFDVTQSLNHFNKLLE